MGVSFERPLALLLLPLALGYAVLLWRSGRARFGTARGRVVLALRLVLLTALVLALAGANVRYTVDRQAVVLVGDLSASVARLRPALEEWTAAALAARRERDAAGIVVMGRDALVEHWVSEDLSFHRFNSTPQPHFTDLAAGLRLAAGLLPAEARRRVVLLSDGRQNLGDAQEQARLLQAQGIRLDVVPLTAAPSPDSLIEGLAVPSRASAGERIPVRVRVQSTSPTSGALRLYLDATQVLEQPVVLRGGREELAFSLDPPGAGFHRLRATLDVEDDALPQNNEAGAFVQVEGPPRVLLVEGAPGRGDNLAAALRAAGMSVDVQAPFAFPALDVLAQYGSVALVDVPAEALGAGAVEALTSFVRDLGHGLITVGGEESYTLGGYRHTPLEALLPVSSDLSMRKDRGRLALVLVIDRSGSMAAPSGGDNSWKIEMATRAAALAAAEVYPDDPLGVVAFDSQFHWVIPLQPLADSGGLKAVQDKITGIQADGGTDIFPALHDGAAAVMQAEAKWKHVVLLTDGQSCCGGNYGALLDQLAASQTTLSTIAVGSDADTTLLRRLAELGQGRYYFTNRARDLPQIMLRETRLASRSATVDEPVVPRFSAVNPALTPLARAGLSLLDGYIVTTPKDTAQVALYSDKGDPLLAQWQVGLGRVASWTADIQGRWSARWLGWPEFPRWWAALVGWSLPPPEGALRLEPQVTGDRGRIVAELPGPLGRDAAGELTARVVGPDLQALDVRLAAVAPGRYEATFPAGQTGVYLVEVQGTLGDQAVRAAAGLAVPYSPEYRAQGADTALLETLAQTGNGRVLAAPSEAFAADLPPVSGRVPLASWLLALALLLLPLDIAARRLAFGALPVEALLPRRRPLAPGEVAAGPPVVAPLERLRVRRTARSSAPGPEAPVMPVSGLRPDVPPPAAAQRSASMTTEQAPTEQTATERLLEARRRRRR